MSVRYDLYETPDPKKRGKKQLLHARIISNGTYSKKDFVERVARFQHFPINLISGVLDAVLNELADSIKFKNVHLRVSKEFKMKVIREMTLIFIKYEYKK